MIISIFKAVSSFKKGKQEKVLKDLTIVPIYLVLLFFTMLIIDLVFINPNEFDRERVFIESNINATKLAYGINYK